jgi:hypothetical protein
MRLRLFFNPCNHEVTMKKAIKLNAVLAAALSVPSTSVAANLELLMAGPWASGRQPYYPIVDTKQSTCFNDLVSIACPAQTTGDFYGQDSQHDGLAPSFTGNGNGTVTDNRTGLMWQQDPGDKKTRDQALAEIGSFALAGYTDWRLPTIKELYSLIQFNGKDASGCDDEGTTCTADDYTPFIDTAFFTFQYGNVYGDRIIDAQYLSSNLVEGGTSNNAESAFGVNFADGRIKGYELQPKGTDKTFFVMYVRDISSDKKYGVNNFKNNGDGTVIDSASGLQWMQADSGAGKNWQEALAYCENLSLAGHDDWRLPNAKELHSIVDYSNAPDTNGKPAINTDYFNSTSIKNENGVDDWPFYWTSTTLETWNNKGDKAVFVAFGRALGYMSDTWVNIHGAGAVKADFKSGDPADHPTGDGPQNGAVRIYNYVRCVRDADISTN